MNINRFKINNRTLISFSIILNFNVLSPVTPIGDTYSTDISSVRVIYARAGGTVSVELWRKDPLKWNIAREGVTEEVRSW